MIKLNSLLFIAILSLGTIGWYVSSNNWQIWDLFEKFGDNWFISWENILSSSISWEKLMDETITNSKIKNSTIILDDLSDEIKNSLSLADSSLQSFSETDPLSVHLTWDQTIDWKKIFKWQVLSTATPSWNNSLVTKKYFEDYLTQELTPSYNRVMWITYSSCSKKCWGWYKSKTLECKRNNEEVVDYSYCDESQKPINTVVCNTDSCWYKLRQTSCPYWYTKIFENTWCHSVSYDWQYIWVRENPVNFAAWSSTNYVTLPSSSSACSVTTYDFWLWWSYIHLKKRILCKEDQ